MSSLKSLVSLKATQLQQLATSCGILKSGTKKDVAQRIADTIEHAKPVSAGERILSVDMGIRNFAFCLLTPNQPAGGGEATTSKKKPGRKRQPAASVLGHGEIRPLSSTLHAWQVLDLTTWDGEGVSSNRAITPVALKLVQEHLLPLRPSRVLIEQQRWRSAGKAAVQEWTLRVNSLEAQLLAILATLRSQKAWDGVVESVDPRRAAPYFFGVDEDGSERKTGRIDAKLLKKMKIDLLGSWIQNQTRVNVVGDQPEQVSAAFLEKWQGPPRSRKSPGESFRKLDDLSDCVVQGMAWLEWQENRMALLENGAESFLERMAKREVNSSSEDID